MSKKVRKRLANFAQQIGVSPPDELISKDKESEPDWTKACSVCGETPVVPATGMCGPCTFGEADTAGGNW
jgi:hypothetical protein